MKFDVMIAPKTLRAVPGLAQQAEALGANGLWTSETQHHPFLPLPLVAEHTQRIQFGTAVAIAFGRSPLSLAHIAWDLAEQSGGRFVLGLGTQVKPHVERRFGMPWPDSAMGKLREMIAAIRAIWRTWQTGARLNFRGEHYKLTLMSPFFNPGPIDHPNVPIYIAGVNTALAQLAGEVADGFHVHAYHTRRYLREVLIPAVAAGAARASRARADVQLTSAVFVAIGEDDAARRAMREDAHRQISFYASTPTYRSVMALHGLDDVAEQLSRLAVRGRWDEMPMLVPDAFVSECVTEGTWDDIGARLRERYDGLLDRLAIYVPLSEAADLERWRRLAEAVRDN
ncbi:MAG: TIGR03617 family F420-dependent LLM class oxidoreductase [Anaerolineales bacterium]